MLKDPGAELHPLSNVKITSGFWNRWMEINRTVTIPSQYEKLVETGRIGALRLDWKPGMLPKPHFFWDSDVAKWIEAACYTVAIQPDENIQRMIDEVIDLVISAQQPDGYINSYFTVVEDGKRWTNLRDKHELYCAGHLFEAAVAHHEVSGKTNFLNAVCRYADYIDSLFGPGPSQKRGYCGHEEIELALIRLYRATDEERYLKLAEFFIEERGRQPYYFDAEAVARGENPSDYEFGPYYFMQAGAPIREQTEMQGHAVRAMYFYAAAADLAAIRSDNTLYAALKVLWEDLTYKKTYVTGGIGSTSRYEGFTEAYDLPNDTAYAETCAAIGSILWNQRMLNCELDGRYADSIERAFYNGTISGASLDGVKYFYTNPLASNGSHHRSEWLECCCCVSNLARLLASLGRYVYSATDSGLVVHQHIASNAAFSIGGLCGSIEQKTDFPWDGRNVIRLNLPRRAEFSVKVRIPDWCTSPGVTVNYAPVDMTRIDKGYLEITRIWADGDLIVVQLPMPVQKVYANPKVSADLGRVALQRGPVVYCLEEIDNACASVALSNDASFSSKFEPDLLGGIVTIEGPASAFSSEGWDSRLYSHDSPVAKPVTIKAVPYYAWDNRAPGWMSVWLYCDQACVI